MRVNLLKDSKKFKTWESNFKKWDKGIRQTLYNRNVKKLLKDTDISKDKFFTHMPFMGVNNPKLKLGGLNRQFS